MRRTRITPPPRAPLREARERSETLVLPASAYAECLVAPHRRGADAVATVDAFVDALPARIEPATRGIAGAAAELRARHAGGLRLPDALVVATALTLGADRLITTDARWPAALRARSRSSSPGGIDATIGVRSRGAIDRAGLASRCDRRASATPGPFPSSLGAHDRIVCASPACPGPRRGGRDRHPVPRQRPRRQRPHRRRPPAGRGRAGRRARADPPRRPARRVAGARGPRLRRVRRAPRTIPRSSRSTSSARSSWAAPRWRASAGAP